MKHWWIFFVTILIVFSCGNTLEEETTKEITIPEDNPIEETNTKKNLKILSLGDSYTIGESVCEKCKFPEQLRDSLLKEFSSETTIDLKVIARTGWTTTNLIDAIDAENLTTDYDLATLLIGVNNQYQRKDFSIYESEFPKLVNTAIKAGNNDKKNVIVVSIPDYAFTPFGRGNSSISSDIDKYNNFAKNYCEANGITFVNITDITREGLTNTALVASDNLHPSALAYTKFVGRILPFALEKIQD
jgi:lysophospholipase L1-like esterase